MQILNRMHFRTSRFHQTKLCLHILGLLSGFKRNINSQIVSDKLRQCSTISSVEVLCCLFLYFDYL